MYDSRKPCGGTNVNVCVAEGCYGEACLIYNRQYKPDQFSGQDSVLFDFPVRNENDFPVKNEKPVKIWDSFFYGMMYLLGLCSLAIAGAGIVGIVMEVRWWTLVPIAAVALATLITHTVRKYRHGKQ